MLVLIVSDTYEQAERMMRGRQNWLWFSTLEIALDWVKRCADRGVKIDPVIRDAIYRRQAA